MVWNLNGYGLVPHRLTYFAINSYGVSEKWIKIIQQYYGGIWNLRERKTTRVKSRMNSTFSLSSKAAREHKKSLSQRCFNKTAHAF